MSGYNTPLRAFGIPPLIHSHAVRRAFTLASLFLPLAVLAQRANENAVTAADDAFGTTVGSQAIGLYDAENVRGFSPRDAGNLRMEGLYFDQQTFSTNGCLVVEQSVRVGLAAQSFDFPSPTGIADFTLHASGPDNLVSVVLSKGSFGMTSLQLEGQGTVPGRPLSASLCFHRFFNSDPEFARRSRNTETGVVVRGQPSAGLELTAFWGKVGGNEHGEVPLVFADGVNEIPVFSNSQLPVQDWTRWRWDELTAGAIVRSTGAGPWTLRAGVFHSAVHNPENFYDLFVDVAPDRTADRILDILPPLRAQATSAEFHLQHLSAHQTHVQQWSFTLRGKSVARNPGGDSVTDLGRVSIDDQLPVPEPTLVFSTPNQDRVRQFGLGVSFEERWPGRGSVGIGAQAVDYQRSVEDPAAGTAKQHQTPILASARFTANPWRKVLIYGSYTRGLEDAALAPANAQNRGASPPATATWQADAGMSITPRPGTQILVGVFEVRKAYFNLDAARDYAQLGQVRHRGLEMSATINGERGLTAVLGGLWMRQDVLRPGDGASAQREIPLGSVPLLLNANCDYAPSQWGPWGLAVELQWLSSRPVTTDDLVRLPAATTASLRVRRKLSLLGHAGVARLEMLNIADATALRLKSSGEITPDLGRRLSLTVALDY